MNIAKHTLIYTLIFSFLLISFFGSYIKITNAQSGTTPVVTWTTADATEYTALKAKQDAGTATPAEEARIEVLKDKSTASLEKPAPATPAPTTPVVTWTTADATEYTALKAKQDAGTATPAEEARIVELQKKSTASLAGTTPVAAPPADDESCTKHCPGGTWWWKVDENIQNAICNMQCTIIDWESSMIGWVVSKVLYPALGLCVENDPSKPCPEPPAATETK